MGNAEFSAGDAGTSHQGLSQSCVDPKMLSVSPDGNPLGSADFTHA
jgi:hypothetical protein